MRTNTAVMFCAQACRAALKIGSGLAGQRAVSVGHEGPVHGKLTKRTSHETLGPVGGTVRPMRSSSVRGLLENAGACHMAGKIPKFSCQTI